MNNPNISKEESKKNTLKQLKSGIHLAAQLILASPLKLPIKLIQGAKYAVLAISLIDGLFEKEKESTTKSELVDEKDGA
ncbi:MULTISPECIES: hypothetical protein [Olivibacter]|jgi:hypothetical protein|uniref:Uncharacterized protein n=1 Tax=Olivibacter oleidegradans TaxID=760123 RepID=A0ABV6HLX3_9SPHI|nr:hypothetical protein [Olivibacter jilunii]MDX3914524.1 hypothetical protein [Pseudosphingobacterium sp.]